MKKKDGMSRRDFIKTSSVTAVGSTFFLSSCTSLSSGVNAMNAVDHNQTTVVLIRDQQVLKPSGKPDYEVLLRMMDRAVSELTGERDALSGWKSLVKPSDRVGIKTNVWRFLPTPSELEQVLATRIKEAGVANKQVQIQDRGLYKDPFFRDATALINTRPLRTHHWSGVGSLIKNYITFVPKPHELHGDSCADLATVWKLPLVNGKTRLNVLVLLTPQFHGKGPHSFNPKWVWNYYGLAVGFDPVAVDTVGLEVLQKKRHDYFGEERPLNPPAKHILLADTRHHIGVADMNKINLVKIGYQKDILI